MTITIWRRKGQGVADLAEKRVFASHPAAHRFTGSNLPQQFVKNHHTIPSSVAPVDEEQGTDPFVGLEKSLCIFFPTSLKSDEVTLEKILRGRIIKLYDGRRGFAGGCAHRDQAGN
jgi:hypothetical protein